MEQSVTAAAPAVTVLMSVRDGERHLRSAVDSILAQSFRDFEFLILDDASVDASRAVVRSYDDPRIRLIENAKNLGLTRSLNQGIALARGRYIARMDADDLSAPDRLARQVEYLDAHPDCAVVATYARKIDAESAELGVARTPLRPEDVEWELRRGNCITHGTVMMRAAALRGVGAYDESMERAQDYDLWLRISEDYDICTLPEFLYSWREHADSVSGRHLGEQDRFAELTKRAALARRVARVVTPVADGGLAPGRGAALLCDLMREQAELRSPLGSAGGVRGRLWRRWPWLRSRRYARSHPEQLKAVRRILGHCAARQLDAATTREALLELVESS